ncbi:hypothetical protein [Hahella sp. HN01]|uniref:hypothetical protein n=1 Tax=Hahella sp. HN01 TaxID=2847262 RepID=UPI001C1E8F8C|nr:hypothetical protein [Hahella sp. HN01]MBU6955767.1 hypothetical protein [Hahella sp. HN01]
MLEYSLFLCSPTLFRISNKEETFVVNGKSDSSLVSAISDFQTSYMKVSSPDGRVDPNGKTFKSLIDLGNSVFKSVAITAPDFGIVTWESEGNEGGKYHSRKLHVPSAVSGLTLGRGYDMRRKDASAIYLDLVNAGVNTKNAEVLKLASGLYGNSAERFIIDNDLLDFQISANTQLNIFKKSYESESNEVERICGKKDVVLAYGETKWDSLNSAIKDIVIDLKFRGDYTGSARKILQQSIVDNDVDEFKKQLSNKSNWPNVPKDRFERRNKFLDKAK